MLHHPAPSVHTCEYKKKYTATHQLRVRLVRVLPCTAAACASTGMAAVLMLVQMLAALVARNRPLLMGCVARQHAMVSHRDAYVQGPGAV